MMKRFAVPSSEGSVRKWTGVAAGAILASVGLELFLMPHRMVVGGLTGMSALFSHFTGMRLGLFLFLFNLPFVLLGYRKVVKRFGPSAVFSILLFSAGVFLLHPAPVLTVNPMLASIAGGSCLGIGIGWVIRYGGFLDLSDYFLERFSRNWTVYALYGFNALLLLCTGWLIGWAEAFHSLVAYALAFWGMGVGFKSSPMTRTLWIASSRSDEIGDALLKGLNRKVTKLPDKSSRIAAASPVVLCTVHRLEETRARALVHRIDPEAVIGTAPRKPFSVGR